MYLSDECLNPSCNCKFHERKKQANVLCSLPQHVVGAAYLLHQLMNACMLAWGMGLCTGPGTMCKETKQEWRRYSGDGRNGKVLKKVFRE